MTATLDDVTIRARASRPLRSGRRRRWVRQAQEQGLSLSARMWAWCSRKACRESGMPGSRLEPRSVPCRSGTGRASRCATRSSPEAVAVPPRAAPAGWSPERDRACLAARPAARRGLPRSPSPATISRWRRTPARPRSGAAARGPAQCPAGRCAGAGPPRRTAGPERPQRMGTSPQTGTRPAGNSTGVAGRPVFRLTLSRVQVPWAGGAAQPCRLTSRTWPAAPIGKPSPRRRSTAPVFGSTSSTVCRRPAGGW